MTFINRLLLKIIFPIVIATIVIFFVIGYTVDRMERQLFYEDWVYKTRIYANSKEEKSNIVNDEKIDTVYNVNKLITDVMNLLEFKCR